MNIDFNTETVDGDDDDKYIKTKIKTYKNSIITNFYNKNESKKIPEEKVPHKCLSIIILDSVIYTYDSVIVIVIMVFILILIMKNTSDSNNNKQIYNTIKPNSIC